MRLRSKLLAGILGTLLLQIAVTGTFTLSTFVVTTRRSQETELSSDWDRARAYVEEMKHRLTTDLYQLSFFLQEDQAAGASATDLRKMMRYFISLTSADRIVLIDEPGVVLVDETTGVSVGGDDLPVGFLNPRDFGFPRNQFMVTKFVSKPTRLYLVTGSSFPRRGGGMRHLYLITNVDKSVVEAIWEKTGTEVAFFAGTSAVVSASPWQSLETEAPLKSRRMFLGNVPYSVYSRPLSADIPDEIYLVAFRSQLAEQVYVRSVLLTYVTAFLIALAASLFLATGFTSLSVSPFTRLAHWLHRYMDTGEVGKLDVRSRDEIGFLAGTFHEMVTTLISEKNVVADQLDQISVLNAYNEGVMNGIPAGIIVAGSDGSIEFCNEYFAALVGAEVSALRGATLRDVMARSFTLRGGGSAGDAFSGEADTVVEGLRRNGANGHALHFTAKGSSLRLAESRRASLIVLEDVTAAERFWARLSVADRVTSMGILSAGMAHEINNPLSTIASHVNYLKAVETERDKLDSISWIESETSRIAAIIRRMRAYSAPGTGHDADADLSRVVRETVEVLRFTLARKKLSLTMDLADEVQNVCCPADELKQVVLNILLNACEACAEEGAIGVCTSGDADGRAVLSVVDNGAGIEPSDLGSIFDPFFTTKLATQGNGLGLSICYAIVKRAGGDIRVTSTPGKGTKVEVILRCS